jgi:hypothetical protein
MTNPSHPDILERVFLACILTTKYHPTEWYLQRVQINVTIIRLGCFIRYLSHAYKKVRNFHFIKMLLLDDRTEHFLKVFKDLFIFQIFFIRWECFLEASIIKCEKLGRGISFLFLYNCHTSVCVQLGSVIMTETSLYWSTHVVLTITSQYLCFFTFCHNIQVRCFSPGQGNL